MKPELLKWVRFSDGSLRFFRKQRWSTIVVGSLFALVYCFVIGKTIQEREWQKVFGLCLLFLPNLLYGFIVPLLLMSKVIRFVGRYREGAPSNREGQFEQDASAFIRNAACLKKFQDLLPGPVMACMGLGALILLPFPMDLAGWVLLITGLLLTGWTSRMLMAKSEQPPPTFEPPKPWGVDTDEV